MGPRPQPAGERLPALLLLSGAVIGLAGNALHPHAAEPDPARAIQALATNDTWIWIHLAIIGAILLIAAGLIVVLPGLAGPDGAPMARVGAVALVAGATIASVSTAIDGFAMHVLAVGAANAGSQLDEHLRVALGIQAVDFAIWSIGMLVFFGAGFACVGGAIVRGGLLAGWYGPVAIASGAGAAFAAFLQVAAGHEVDVAEIAFLVSSLVITAWVAALGVRLWRGGIAAEAADPARTGDTLARSRA